MKNFALIAICFVLTSTHALALSCGESSMAQQFIWAQNSDERYVIVKGKMRVNAPSKQTLVKDLENNTELYGYRARFTGTSLSKKGFSARFKAPVTVELSCFNGWCGQVPDTKERIYFLKKRDKTYISEEGACDFTVDSAPTQENIRVLQRCISGGPCKP